MIKVKYYNNQFDNKAGYCNKNVIFVNMAHNCSNEEIRATIVHEMAHIILHFGRKHYTPAEKEYQATMVAYNYCHSKKTHLEFLLAKKKLVDENVNLTPLRSEVKNHYKNIVNRAKEVKI